MGGNGRIGLYRATADRLANIETLELRVPEIERLVSPLRFSASCLRRNTIGEFLNGYDFLVTITKIADGEISCQVNAMPGDPAGTE
jgi:hypothetical protein